MAVRLYPSTCREPQCSAQRDKANGSFYCEPHTSIRWALYQTESTHGGYDSTWQKKRKRFLYLNPWCVECSQPATVADHHPDDRRSMWARGWKDLDEPKRLRPMCRKCHNAHTAKEQGSLSKNRRTKSVAEREYERWQRERGTD